MHIFLFRQFHYSFFRVQLGSSALKDFIYPFFGSLNFEVVIELIVVSKVLKFSAWASKCENFEVVLKSSHFDSVVNKWWTILLVPSSVTNKENCPWNTLKLSWLRIDSLRLMLRNSQSIIKNLSSLVNKLQHPRLGSL